MLCRIIHQLNQDIVQKILGFISELNDVLVYVNGGNDCLDHTMNEAIEFVMLFYNISREDAVNLYWDEIEAYMQLFNHRVVE